MAENKTELDFNVTEAISKTESFVDQNKKSLSVILVALVVAIGGYLFYTKVYVSGKEKEASVLLFKAEQYFKMDSLNLAINGDGNNPGLEEIASDYGMSPSGNIARYYLGMAYLKTKEFDKAIDALKSYDANDEITGSLALCAIGDAHMELDQTKEAVSYYERASKENPNNFSTPIILMKLGLALEMTQDYKGALKVYEKIKKDYSSTPEGSQIDKYLARAEALAGK
ncbi:MAG: tetratricopeptide repeat protein [Bacteroidetes bacterium]|nr:MAG: tetratricopeptide repeat protein [Bacteroidota bacterium]REK07048.1 MAG: tetratricopeptide repeat protein [Bacteroidota bacterium]REK33605.1 MAG: tetratricopeptide repeat protein [Bacteroidota bacterium]REK48590.1 MAG: tetratricopeptide repeat protein [Bacteroidota bacterium]